MTSATAIKPCKKDREAAQANKQALAAYGIVIDGKVAKCASQLDEEAALNESGPAAPPANLRCLCTAKEPPERNALYNTGSDYSLKLRLVYSRCRCLWSEKEKGSDLVPSPSRGTASAKIAPES